ncbi:MAG: transcriptional regulator [Gammaproteobacteria bacterium]|nr:transcriptional regulator [Gammaproteobacteria bacterium]
MNKQQKTAELTLPIERDLFLRNLLRELSGTLEEVIGLDEASGFISIVGQRIGDWINTEYRKALDTELLPPDQIAAILIDLKSRIEGEFYLIKEDEEKIVLGNHRCPFGEKILGRPSLCMMTSNVFGTITAENLGYAKVCLNATISQGAPECRVTIYKEDSNAAEEADGREYYKG